MNVIDFFEKTAARHPDRAAFVFEGEEWSYARTDELACRIANGLREMGVVRESKCAVLSRNDPRAVTIMLGIFKAQGAWVPLHTGDGDDHILYVADFFDVEVLFYQKEFERLAAQVRETLPAVRHFVCIDGEGEAGPSLESWAGACPADAVLLPWDPDAVCMVRGTGGTTGRPKGVMNTNRNLETAVANYMANFRFDAPPVYLASPPLSHAAGIFAIVTMAMAGTTVIQHRFDVRDTMLAIARHKVSLLYLPPTALYKILSEPDVREHDYSSMRHFLYGAAPTSSAKLREAIEVFGPVMTQGYGQTEVPSSVCFMGPHDHMNADGSVNEERLLACGRPTPFSRVALLDDDDREVEPGAVGEIAVRGGLVMKGYYKNPEASAETFRNGWHHTGDLAYQDADGFIYICDRKKEMIITGGFNVYPLELEQVILSHPAVQDCAVVGVPDEKWGEAIKAVVELKDGREVPADVLIAMCKERLGSVKTPKSVDFTDDLPRSAVGKVMRKAVRARYWEGRERMVS